MIAFLSICYGAIYFLLFEKLKLIKKSAANISTFVGVGVVLIGAIVFMWITFAPTSKDARVFQYIIPIVPNVSGQVIDVPVEPLIRVERDDVLYRIDPAPYQFTVAQLQASVDQAEAQRTLAQIEVTRAEGLVRASAAAQSQLDQWRAQLAGAEASIASLEAQLGNAQWQLDETVVRAPSTGYVINLQLRPGAYVTNMPIASAMAFVSDETHEVVASFSQSAIRYINVGDSTEVVFTTIPGQIYTGVVTHIVRFSAQAQESATSQLPTLTGAPLNDRWVIRAELDDAEAARTLPQGAGGTIAVYTEHGRPVHVISRIVMRMQAWLGYLTSP